MTSQEIEAIAGGYHADPFHILGPHRRRDDQPGWEVRAFLPHASEATVLVDGSSRRMNKEHDSGFFCAFLDGGPQPYRIQAKLWDGPSVEFEDPYRFPPLLSDYEIYLHAEGNNFESYRMLGAHLVEVEGVRGVRFAVWAPNAEVVSVAGDFNQWDERRHPMRRRDAGIWEIFIPGLAEGHTYKYFVRSRFHGHRQLKADPYAFLTETPPKSASVVWDVDKYQWRDAEWLETRARTNLLERPVSIYEVHIESWMRKPDHSSLSYRELAHTLVEYVRKMGYTHIELMPIAEYPFSGSWGYQVINYYSPTSRFGTPEDLMYLVDCCHLAGIGVIIDWVPAHFPRDAHGLVYFDGTALYEHADPRVGEHREWGTMVFNYARNEVREFLISNALFWLKQYHIDGLRVDAVASMLYLDYSRKEGEWLPNQYGGRENLDAIDFLRKFNEKAHEVPGAITAAEESTAFTGVSRPVYLGGLGFTFKWNMGWMHDMLHYFSEDPVHRKYHHNSVTFSMLYAFTENFILPISHDEVVYGKRSVLSKMPGDEWQRFANARAFLAYMWMHPGKKLVFMGSEIGQYEEWNHDSRIRWELLDFDYHRKLQDTARALNEFYQSQPALYEVDYQWEGFEWVDIHDWENSVIAFRRIAKDKRDSVFVFCNFTPIPRTDYRFGVPEAGYYRELFNTDSALFGGSNMGNAGGRQSEPVPSHGRDHSIAVTLPPLAVVMFKKE